MHRETGALRSSSSCLPTRGSVRTQPKHPVLATTQLTYDTLERALPAEIIVYALRTYATDVSLWAFFFHQRWQPESEAVSWLRGTDWCLAYRLRHQLDRILESQEDEEEQSSESEEEEAHSPSKRAHLYHARLTSATTKMEQAILRAFLYDEYSKSQATSGRWLREFAHHLVSHGQQLRREKQFATAEIVLQRGIATCKALQKMQTTPEQKAASGGLENTLGVAYMNLAQLMRLRKKMPEAEQLLKEAEKTFVGLSERHCYRSFNLACVQCLRGNKDECRRWLDLCFLQDNVTMYWFADESDLDDVRGEKWFSELLGRVAERDKKRQDRYSAAPRDASRCVVM